MTGTIDTAETTRITGMSRTIGIAKLTETGYSLHLIPMPRTVSAIDLRPEIILLTVCILRNV